MKGGVSGSPACVGRDRADALFELRSIRKTFGGFVALDDVSLSVSRGKVRGLVGENGAGKTTLMLIASGLYRPDAGALLIDGREHRFSSPLDAFDAGLAMVHQQVLLVRDRTVAENIVLGERTRRRLSRRDVARRVNELAEQYELKVTPERLIADLSPAERQRVGLLAALHRESRVLILDEPTAVIAPREVDALFESIRRLTADGRGVIFVSHKLGEVLDICDDVTVLRHGRVQAHLPCREATGDQLARLMVGAHAADLQEVKASDRQIEGSDDAHRPDVLRVRRLTVPAEHGGAGLHHVELTVGAGEVLGVAGVEDNGQDELVGAVTGLRASDSDELSLAGRDLRSLGVRERNELGVAFIPADAGHHATVSALDIASNLALRSYRGRGWRRWWLDRRGIEARAKGLSATYDVRGATPRAAVGDLSGGNQQKVVLARELSNAPILVAAVNPTVGLDVGASRMVHDSLRSVTARGGGVLLVSSDLDELDSLSDRIVVLYRGRVAGAVARRPDRRERIGRLMGGLGGGEESDVERT